MKKYDKKFSIKTNKQVYRYRDAKNGQKQAVGVSVCKHFYIPTSL